MTPKKTITRDAFATQFAELEKIVRAFEEENISIDRGVALFEKGLILAQELKKHLSAVENTITTLKEHYRIPAVEENEK